MATQYRVRIQDKNDFRCVFKKGCLEILYIIIEGSKNHEECGNLVSCAPLL